MWMNKKVHVAPGDYLRERRAPTVWNKNFVRITRSVPTQAHSAAGIGSRPDAWFASGPRKISLLDANYRRVPGRDELGR
jgi:hypothetical protein